jgi:hypothetical protein
MISRINNENILKMINIKINLIDDKINLLLFPASR